MGAVKRNLIPENYNCSHFLDVDDCPECQHSLQTSHLPVIYTPSFETWYQIATSNPKPAQSAFCINLLWLNLTRARHEIY